MKIDISLLRPYKRIRLIFDLISVAREQDKIDKDELRLRSLSVLLSLAMNPIQQAYCHRAYQNKRFDISISYHGSIVQKSAARAH